MEGFRFYAEMPEHRASKRASSENFAFTREMLREHAALGCNCVAVVMDDGLPAYQPGGKIDAMVPFLETVNASVVSGSVDRGYLRSRCVRISEELARRLHPAMFATLDREG